MVISAPTYSLSVPYYWHAQCWAHKFRHVSFKVCFVYQQFLIPLSSTWLHAVFLHGRHHARNSDIWFIHHDVIKWKHFPRYWHFVRGFHRSPVNSPHKDQWRGVLMFSMIRAWTNSWANNGEAGYLRRHRAHNDVIVMNTLWFGGTILRHRSGKTLA